jgi:hypothetical protein
MAKITNFARRLKPSNIGKKLRGGTQKLKHKLRRSIYGLVTRIKPGSKEI